MFKRGLAAAMMLVAAQAGAAEPIEGNWRTANGDTAQIAKCGRGFCVTLKTGKHAGKQVGSLSIVNGEYTGRITDLDSDRTYSGSSTAAIHVFVAHR
ncbi:DUF2147 domain-containing protein [Neorhizobium lilium]|nr:DUF2147 domain-containing protein [Neorhizobium lilium]